MTTTREYIFDIPKYDRAYIRAQPNLVSSGTLLDPHTIARHLIPLASRVWLATAIKDGTVSLNRIKTRG